MAEYGVTPLLHSAFCDDRNTFVCVFSDYVFERQHIIGLHFDSQATLVQLSAAPLKSFC